MMSKLQWILSAAAALLLAGAGGLAWYVAHGEAQRAHAVCRQSGFSTVDVRAGAPSGARYARRFQRHGRTRIDCVFLNPDTLEGGLVVMERRGDRWDKTGAFGRDWSTGSATAR